VRRVTEINAGRKAAGVDGRVVLTAEDTADLVTCGVPEVGMGL
jgi:hypothetical protein